MTSSLIEVYIVIVILIILIRMDGPSLWIFLIKFARNLYQKEAISL
jgi:hypothetical protein